MQRLTIERRALERLVVILCVAIGVVLMHAVSTDHDLMRISAPSGQVMKQDLSAQIPQSATVVAKGATVVAKGATVVAKGNAPMAMAHTQCLAVLRAPNSAPHIPLTLTAVLPGDANISAYAPRGETRLPSRASPPDLATELCISRT